MARLYFEDDPRYDIEGNASDCRQWLYRELHTHDFTFENIAAMSDEEVVERYLAIAEPMD